MSKRCISLLFVLVLSRCSEGANILGIIPTPSYSHQVAYMDLWKELSLRGHKVTVLTTDPVNNPKLTNLTEIDLKRSYKFFENISDIAENTMTMWNAYDQLITITIPLTHDQISYAPVQDLIHSKKHFDVVLVEFWQPQFLAFAELFNCPKVIISSLEATALFHRALGNPAHPVLQPDLISSFFGSLNFLERLEITLFDLYVTYYFHYKYYPKCDEIVKKYFNTTVPVKDMIRDVDMMFVNVNPVIQGTRALGPTTINVGDRRNTTVQKQLPLDVKEFLDSAKEGFIYFSLGSNVKSKDLNKETLNTLTETLKELPYKILWKFETDTFPNKPDNVKLIKWAPQQTILAHPNIKLFITQGGLQSMEESIYSEVPLVVIPFFGDQEQNAKLMKSKGIAEIVSRRPVEKSKLKSAILEVINNPKYKNSVKRLKHLALDTPMTGLEKAVWWTEYVIRNKGAKHLRNPAADIPLYQYFLVDVIGFLVSVLAAVVFVLYIAIKKLYKFVQKLLQPVKLKEKKEQ